MSVMGLHFLYGGGSGDLYPVFFFNFAKLFRLCLTVSIRFNARTFYRMAYF